MSLIEVFRGTALTLADVEQFIERAKVLGHGPKTLVGRPGVGLKLVIGEQSPKALYCSGDCNRVFEEEELLFSPHAGKWAIPFHVGSRSFNCAGSGKAGVTKK